MGTNAFFIITRNTPCIGFAHGEMNYLCFAFGETESDFTQVEKFINLELHFLT